ncbi:MAG: DUF4296 domain-containing protein [Bacteroidales bacterium]|nr:DUF4296 domain-containing protein [Bacteroidales bacterium]
MKRIGIFTLSLLLTVISCAPRADIPVKKMVEIYYEIAILDQFVDNNPEMRTQSDSMKVYAPLLDKYGYTEEEFLNSIHFYLRDPENFLRIIEAVNQKLSEREQYLSDLQQTEEGDDRRMMDEVVEFDENAPIDDRNIIQGYERGIRQEDERSIRDSEAPEPSIRDTSIQDTSARKLPETKKRRTKTREKRLSKEDLLEISKKFKEQDKK